MNIKYFKLKSDFIKNILIVAGGTASAQLINIFASPIITRIYTPEEFGVLTLYMSILSVIAVIGSLRYEWAIPISKDEKSALNLLLLSIMILSIFVLVLTLVLYKFGDEIFSFLNIHKIYDYQYLLPLGLFFAGLYNIFTQWTLRDKDFKAISKTKFNQSFWQNATKIGLGFFNIGSVGLIIGTILGQSIGITTLARTFRKKIKYNLKKIDFTFIEYCAKRYVRFPLYSAPSQLLNTLGIYLPVFFLSIIYGPEVLGYYGLANTIVNLPVNLIGMSVADVFYSEAATTGRKNPGKLKKLAIDLLKKLILIGLFPLLVLIFWGPSLFSLVFGSQWREAGVYSQIISFLVFARFVFTPISRVFSVFEKQQLELLLDVFRVLLVSISFTFIYFVNMNVYFALGIYSLVMIIVYLISYLYARKVISSAMKSSN